MARAADKLICDAGREMAVEWLRSAVESASSSEMMANQMKLLTSASIHVLATVVYNVQRLSKATPKPPVSETIAAFVNDLTKEVEIMLNTPEGDIETAEVGGQQPTSGAQ